jgi:hypothetical protein
MLFELLGTEDLTVEVGASLPLSSARELWPQGLTFETRADRAVASLLVFHMRGLHGRGLPAPSFDYWEALWRLGVMWDGVPAWFGCACDLDRPLIAWAGKRFIRYPVRRASFTSREHEAGAAVTVTVSGVSFQLGANFGEAVAPVPPRRLIVRDRGAFFEIPWEEEPAPFRKHAEITILDASLAHETLGRGVSFDRVGLVHRGRVHRCGLARRL